MSSASSAAPADLPVPSPATQPLDLFVKWLAAAGATGIAQPEAMALATATSDGLPSVRMVLFRGITGGGIRFFTNRDSRKGHELDANPQAAAVFFWDPLGRQVRFEGRIEPLTPAEDDVYFAARPRGHQLAAVASRQSTPTDSVALHARYDQLELQYAGAPVPRPAHWGGYRLIPRMIEFWTSRENRLHDRAVFHAVGDPPSRWTFETLSP